MVGRRVLTQKATALDIPPPLTCYGAAASKKGATPCTAMRQTPGDSAMLHPSGEMDHLLAAW